MIVTIIIIDMRNNQKYSPLTLSQSSISTRIVVRSIHGPPSWILSFHKGSALIGRINTALAASPADEDKLRQLKLSLTDKLQVLNILDDDIVDATPEDKLAREIEQADEAREEIHLALPCPDLLSIVQWYYLLLSQL